MAPITHTYADTYDNSGNGTNNPGQIFTSPFAGNETHQKVSVLLNYVRDVGPSWAPGLPSAVRDPAGWMMNSLRDIEDDLGLGGDDDDRNSHTGSSIMSSVFQPVSSLMQPPNPAEAEALWLSPNYHHKGFLPFHDAMIMGFSMRHAVFNDSLRFELRPYYAQNWVSDRGYYGAEMSIAIGPQLGLKEVGKIALRYVEGSSQLMDRGHGFDLHSEMKLTDHWSFHAGVRENDNSDLGNYVMVKWKLDSWN